MISVGTISGLKKSILLLVDLCTCKRKYQVEEKLVKSKDKRISTLVMSIKFLEPLPWP